MRAFTVLHEAAASAGDERIAYWSLRAIEREKSRIGTAVTFLADICHQLESNGCPVVVMKSLDHWPDLGNDLDLYSTASEQKVVEVFTTRLRAEVEHRSRGDRLAQKWNFKIPDCASLSKSTYSASDKPANTPLWRNAWSTAANIVS